MSERSGLRPHFHRRSRFRGVFIKYGRKPGFKGRIEQTVLLRDIVETVKPDEILTDHLWFNLTKGFQELNLQSGDILEFNARVDIYEKGYAEDSEDNPKRFDYKLNFPRKIERVGRAEGDFSHHNAYNQEVTQKVLDHEARRKERVATMFEQRALPQSQTPSSISPNSAPSKPKKVSSDRKLTDFF